MFYDCKQNQQATRFAKKYSAKCPFQKKKERKRDRRFEKLESASASFSLVERFHANRLTEATEKRPFSADREPPGPWVQLS